MKRTLKNLVKTLALLLIALFVSVELGYANVKIIATAVKLIDCNLYIQDYNNSTVKTDADTGRILEIQEKRDSLYNSEDWMIRTYSNSPSIIKFVVAIFAFIIFVLIPFVWILAIVMFAKEMTIRKQRKRKKVNRNNRVA